MANALATTRGTAVATAANPWEEASQGSDGFTGKYAKFSGKTGMLVAGEDEDEIEPGTQFIVDFNLITRGFVCWKDSAPVDRVAHTIVSGVPLPSVSSLTDHGPYEKHPDGTEDGWVETHSLPFIIDDENDDNAYLLQLSSFGGIKTMKQLYKAYGKVFQSKIDENGNYLLPLIEFDVDSYKHKNKRIGTIYTPVLKIVDWLSQEEVGARLALLGNDVDGEDADVDADDGAADEVEEERTPAPRTSGRRQRSQAEAVEETDIEPEDHGNDETEEEDAPPAGRRAGRRAAAAPVEEEDAAPKGRTTGATGRRAKRF